jgi:3-hydroxymyristoyl/3-hydroxydecanoyl-(acyl carrier protein) dehydratase
MEDLESLIAGDAYSCFGEGFAATASHMRTPSIPGGRLRLFDTVAEFDPNGGPWGRGYLRAVGEVRPDAWFYASHFHNDPCMPATLVAEGAVHAAGFLMLAMGFGIHRDGWRFEPAQG